MKKKLPFKNIAVSGDVSTGKSTLAKNLAKALGWRYLSAGEYVRRLYKEHEFPLEDVYKIPKALDRELDMGYQQMMRDESGVVFESHLAGWLAKDIPKTFKILCIANFGVRMQRAAKREGVSVAQATEDALKRSADLAKKFKKLYGVKNGFDKKYFDLVVDTTVKSKEEVLQDVLQKLTK